MRISEAFQFHQGLSLLLKFQQFSSTIISFNSIKDYRIPRNVNGGLRQVLSIPSRIIQRTMTSEKNYGGMLSIPSRIIDVVYHNIFRTPRIAFNSIKDYPFNIFGLNVLAKYVFQFHQGLSAGIAGFVNDVVTLIFQFHQGLS